MRGHYLLYRAGTWGLGRSGIPDNAIPHWYCSCGHWRVNRDPVKGTPQLETAKKHHKEHIRATVSQARGQGEKDNP